MQAVFFLLNAVVSFFCTLFLLRFMMQLARVSFAGQIGDFVVKTTNWAVKPLRRIVPGVAGVDWASLIAALWLQLMMAGLLPFFRRFDALPTIEDSLHECDPHALLGVLHAIRRAQRAADYALDWAIRRHDLNLEEVRIAALLHDLAEILVGCFAPALALEIQARRRAQPKLRSSEAQMQVIGMSFQDIQLALCKVWHLPDLLGQLIDDSQAGNPRVRNVSLAVRLARHSANGWNDPALPDDYRAIESFLHQGHSNFLERVGAPEEMVVAARLAEGE